MNAYYCLASCRGSDNA